MPAESPERLIRKLHEGHRGGAFFLHGEEAHLKEEAVRALIDAHLEPGARDFNLDEVRADDATPETIASLIQTPPMMGDWRVVVVRNAESLSSSPTTRSMLEDVTASPPPGLALLLVAEIGDSKAKIWKTVKKQATAVAFPRLSDGDLPGWLMSWAEDHGLRLEVDAARALASAIGSDLATLVREMEKLRDYVDGETIQRGDVEAVVGAIARQDRWEWFDTVGAGNFAEARRTLPILLEAGESGVGLVIGLASQLLRIGLHVAGGERALAAALPKHQRRWLPRRIGGQARSWTPERVRRALQHLSRADRLLKSAPLSDTQIMEELLLRLEYDRRDAA